MIREETPADRKEIRLINRAAFAGDEEADLIGKLRDAGLVVGPCGIRSALRNSSRASSAIQRMGTGQ
ncbi:MAG TPA: hypothetical protein VM120_00230 [Bryobacteraceae bacterium]|nr:hypothetical protein [Bryobacteraceae bacterium]